MLLGDVRFEMSLFARQCLVTPDFKPGPLPFSVEVAGQPNWRYSLTH